MTLNQIRYFITLSETLSYTEASKCLFITQPNLSRQIQSMEEEIGLQLFVRHSRTIKLTPAGAILYQQFKNLLDDYNNAIEEAIQVSKGYDGHFSIGVLDIYDIDDMYKSVLHNIRSAHPQLELNLKRNSLGGLITDLKNGTVDLIITYAFSLFDQPDLVTVNVGKFDSCILMNQNHPLADKENLTLSDLKDELFVQLHPNICLEGADYINTLFNHAGIHPQTKWVGSMNDIMLWVETENGVSITSNCTTEKYNNKVKVIPIDMPEAKGHDITIGWKKENYNPAIAMFMEQVEGAIRK